MLTAREARPPRPGDPEPFDRAVLTRAERHLRRRVIRLVHGDRLLVDLAEPLVLAQGTRLVLADGRQAEVIAAEEDLAEITGPALARYAWHIGNRHTPAQVEAGRLLIARDPVLEAMLAGLGASVRPVAEPFEPEGGAYAAGHAHG